jgi:phosphinothricin acetyltransferase
VARATDPTVRPALEGDAEAIRAIRNAAIEHTSAIWTDRTLGPAESRKWFDEYLERRSMWVAAADGDVVAYACWAPWRTKDGYRHTFESSVYVADGHQGRGIGRLLMTTLIPAAREAGAHVLVANIEASNDASIALHRRLGFVTAGTVREVGTKFDRWLDLTIMQLVVGGGLPRRGEP